MWITLASYGFSSDAVTILNTVLRVQLFITRQATAAAAQANLVKQQEELERKAAELERKEQELQNRTSGSANTGGERLELFRVVACKICGI